MQIEDVFFILFIHFQSIISTKKTYNNELVSNPLCRLNLDEFYSSDWHLGLPLLNIVFVVSDYSAPVCHSNDVSCRIWEYSSTFECSIARLWKRKTREIWCRLPSLPIRSLTFYYSGILSFAIGICDKFAGNPRIINEKICFLLIYQHIGSTHTAVFFYYF